MSTSIHRRVSRPCLFLLAGLLSGAAVTASASTGQQFVRLRNQKHADLSLTIAKAQTDPARYVGKVMELRGKVGGVISTSEGLSIMLTMADDSAPTLQIPPEEASLIQEFSSPRLRVLVQVDQGGNGNVVPLKVLAIAQDGEVNIIEQEEAARVTAAQKAAERRRQASQRWQREADRSVHYGQSTAPVSGMNIQPLSSRGAADASGLSSRARPLFVPYFNYISQVNPRLDANAVGQITFHLLNFSDRYNVDPRLVVAMIIAESGFNPNSTSHSGAMGLGQLMPGTAKALGVDNPYDPVQNLGGCINYLRSRLDTFANKALPGGGMSFEQVALAMAAYNAGAGAVKKYNGIPPFRETQAYVKRVISIYQQLCR